MSDADPLTERDEQVLEAASGPADTDDPAESGEDIAALRERVEQLEAENQALRDAYHDLEDDFAAFRQAFAGKLHDLEQAMDGEVNTAGATTLQKYASMPSDVREDTLGPSEQRAVAIYEHWQELAWKGTNGQYVVDTAREAPQKNAPSRFKRDLTNKLDEGLQWIEVYRAMKAVARLSGGEMKTDDYGREHLVGGDFEYHEKTTPDNNRSKKVLVEVDR